MLWNGNNQPSRSSKGSMRFKVDPFVVLYVFDDVECPQYIKFFLERHIPGIHLNNFPILHASRRKYRAFGKQLAPDYRRAGPGRPNGREHISGAAPDLQYASRGGK